MSIRTLVVLLLSWGAICMLPIQAVPSSNSTSEGHIEDITGDEINQDVPRGQPHELFPALFTQLRPAQECPAPRISRRGKEKQQIVEHPQPQAPVLGDRAGPSRVQITVTSPLPIRPLPINLDELAFQGEGVLDSLLTSEDLQNYRHHNYDLVPPSFFVDNEGFSVYRGWRAVPSMDQGPVTDSGPRKVPTTMPYMPDQLGIRTTAIPVLSAIGERAAAGRGERVFQPASERRFLGDPRTQPLVQQPQPLPQPSILGRRGRVEEGFGQPLAGLPRQRAARVRAEVLRFVRTMPHQQQVVTESELTLVDEEEQILQASMPSQGIHPPIGSREDPIILGSDSEADIIEEPPVPSQTSPPPQSYAPITRPVRVRVLDNEDLVVAVFPPGAEDMVGVYHHTVVGGNPSSTARVFRYNRFSEQIEIVEPDQVLQSVGTLVYQLRVLQQGVEYRRRQAIQSALAQQAAAGGRIASRTRQSTNRQRQPSYYPTVRGQQENLPPWHQVPLLNVQQRDAQEGMYTSEQPQISHQVGAEPVPDFQDIAEGPTPVSIHEEDLSWEYTGLGALGQENIALRPRTSIATPTVPANEPEERNFMSTFQQDSDPFEGDIVQGTVEQRQDIVRQTLWVPAFVRPDQHRTTRGHSVRTGSTRRLLHTIDSYIAEVISQGPALRILTSESPLRIDSETIHEISATPERMVDQGSNLLMYGDIDIDQLVWVLPLEEAFRRLREFMPYCTAGADARRVPEPARRTIARSCRMTRINRELGQDETPPPSDQIQLHAFSLWHTQPATRRQPQGDEQAIVGGAPDMGPSSFVGHTAGLTSRVYLVLDVSFETPQRSSWVMERMYYIFRSLFQLSETGIRAGGAASPYADTPDMVPAFMRHHIRHISTMKRIQGTGRFAALRFTIQNQPFIRSVMLQDPQLQALGDLDLQHWLPILQYVWEGHVFLYIEHFYGKQMIGEALTFPLRSEHVPDIGVTSHYEERLIEILERSYNLGGAESDPRSILTLYLGAEMGPGVAMPGTARPRPLQIHVELPGTSGLFPSQASTILAGQVSNPDDSVDQQVPSRNRQDSYPFLGSFRLGQGLTLRVLNGDTQTFPTMNRVWTRFRRNYRQPDAMRTDLVADWTPEQRQFQRDQHMTAATFQYPFYGRGTWHTWYAAGLAHRARCSVPRDRMQSHQRLVSRYLRNPSSEGFVSVCQSLRTLTREAHAIAHMLHPDADPLRFETGFQIYSTRPTGHGGAPLWHIETPLPELRQQVRDSVRDFVARLSLFDYTSHCRFLPTQAWQLYLRTWLETFTRTMIARLAYPVGLHASDHSDFLECFTLWYRMLECQSPRTIRTHLWQYFAEDLAWDATAQMGIPPLLLQRFIYLRDGENNFVTLGSNLDDVRVSVMVDDLFNHIRPGSDGYAEISSEVMQRLINVFGELELVATLLDNPGHILRPILRLLSVEGLMASRLYSLWVHNHNINDRSLSKNFILSRVVILSSLASQWPIDEQEGAQYISSPLSQRNDVLLDTGILTSVQEEFFQNDPHGTRLFQFSLPRLQRAAGRVRTRGSWTSPIESSQSLSLITISNLLSAWARDVYESIHYFMPSRQAQISQDVPRLHYLQSSSQLTLGDYVLASLYGSILHCVGVERAQGALETLFARALQQNAVGSGDAFPIEWLVLPTVGARRHISQTRLQIVQLSEGYPLDIQTAQILSREIIIEQPMRDIVIPLNLRLSQFRTLMIRIVALVVLRAIDTYPNCRGYPADR